MDLKSWNPSRQLEYTGRQWRPYFTSPAPKIFITMFYSELLVCHKFLRLWLTFFLAPSPPTKADFELVLKLDGLPSMRNVLLPVFRRTPYRKEKKINVIYKSNKLKKKIFISSCTGWLDKRWTNHCLKSMTMLWVINKFLK